MWYLTCKAKHLVMEKPMKVPQKSTVAVNNRFTKKVKNTRRDLSPGRLTASDERKYAIVKYEHYCIDNVAHNLSPGGKVKPCVNIIRK